MNPRNPTQPLLPDWSGVGDHAHGVQFYSDDSSLTNLLTGYAGTALINGDAAIVVATRAHRDALTECFTSRGFDSDVAARQGRYIALDAEETLAQFWGHGRLDIERFDAVMGGVLTRARTATGAGRSRMAVFGEMVALLSLAGQPDGALQLEEAWNGLLKTHSFSLCCAYPMQLFGSEDPGRFLRVCAQHTHVYPVAQHSSRFASWPIDRAAAADNG